MSSKSVDKTHHSVFPFKYFDKTYDGCTKDGTELGMEITEGKLPSSSWCATEVDVDGWILKTGFCDPDCPGESTKLSKTY